MTYQYHLALNQVDGPLSSRYIVSQGGYWVLHRNHMAALALQRCDLISPARAIGPYTMYKNNRWFFVIGGLCLAAVTTIKVKSRIDLSFDVFMIFDLTLHFR